MPTSYNQNTPQRTDFACTAYQDQYILIAGGSNQNGDSTSTVIYDMENHTHSDLPDLPVHMNNCEGAIINDAFHVICPDNKILYRLSLSERSKSTWEKIHCSSVKSDSNEKKIYKSDLLSVGIYGKMFRYDVDKNKRIRIPKMPTTAFDFTTATIGNQIYVIGGINYHSQYLTSMMIFDTSTSTQCWRAGPSLPMPLAGASATIFQEYIVVTGGKHDDNAMSNQVFIFDTLTQQWTQKIFRMLQPRTNHKCVCVGSQIVCVGGWNRRKNYCSMEVVPIEKEILNELVRLRSKVQVPVSTPNAVNTVSKKGNNFTSRAKKLFPRWNKTNHPIQL